MTGWLRPEALRRILALREVLVGAGAMALGLWWALGSTGLMRWLGAVLAVGGVAVAREGAIRLGRPRDGGGAGVVSVTERQITYLSGPGGGAVSADSLARVAIVRPGSGPAVWHLTDAEGRHVAVPVNAENAAALFDALAALPGLAQEDLVSAARRGGGGEEVLWLRGPERLG